MTNALRGKQASEWQFNLVMMGVITSVLLQLIGLISLSIFFQIGVVMSFFVLGIGVILIFIEQYIIERLIFGGLLITCACLLAYRFF